MTGLIIGLHMFVCFLLIVIILIQAGRGTGLVEGFSGVESMFGTKTNALLTRVTAILSTLFFITCLGLALLSAKQSRSLMRDLRVPAQTAVKEEAQKEATAPVEPEKQAQPQQPQGQEALPKAEK